MVCVDTLNIVLHPKEARHESAIVSWVMLCVRLWFYYNSHVSQEQNARS